MPDVLSIIKLKVREFVNEESYKTWIEPIEFAEIKKDKCILVVPNIFFRDWIISHFEPMIISLIKEHTKTDVSIEYLLKKDKQTSDQRGVYKKKRSTYTQFNPRYTFESFVVGSSNQFANAASLAVATNPGKTYNPLFIYGGVGLGKTHLLNAIGNFITDHEKIDINNICYITAEVFTNELVNSIRFEKMEDFRNKFRKMDVLLIDDIQFIAGKERTQAEFFHTFNALYEGMKQIVVTSDKFPRDIENFEERLRSRFEWGLIADIQSPDIETKVAILNKKAESENIKLPLDAAFYIASNIDDSVRSLEGSLIRVKAFASLNNEVINLDLVKQIMSGLIKDKKRVITIDMIIKEVATFFSIKMSDIKSEKRIKSIILPRQIALYLSRKLTDSSLVSIGEKFGGKDHATVIHSIKKIKEEMSLKKDIKETVEKIETIIKST